MNISPIKNFNIFNNFKIKSNFPFSGLRLNSPLKADTVNFTGRHKDIFASKKEALEYYKNIAQKVNSSLDDEDELTAFETLGYDVDSDFDTDEITINGDYKPYFGILTGSSYSQSSISYEEAGIDEERLLQNVKKIKGKRYVSPSFVPNEDYKIDRTVEYPDKVAKRLDKILQQRAQKVNDAIGEKDYKKAFDILGFETTQDENGNITIEGSYSAALLHSDTAGIKTLNDYGIDESLLLEKVVKINGEAEFLSSYKPDHYIETGAIQSVRLPWSHRSVHNIRQEFAKLNPKYSRVILSVKDALEQNDNLRALHILGYNASSGDNGQITIEGSYYPHLSIASNGSSESFNYSELGFDDDALLANVKKVKGDLWLSRGTAKKIDKDMEVEECIFLPKESDPSEIFGDFMNFENIASLYDSLDKNIIESYIRCGRIKPDLDTNQGYYFRSFEGDNKAFLDDLISKRGETVLTSKELQEKYGAGSVSVDHALQEGSLKPYGLEDFEFSIRAKSANYVFDITDERNASGIKKLEKNGRQRLYRANSDPMVSRGAYVQACVRNEVKCSSENPSTKAFPATDLEKLGYGTKADLIANCGIRTNAHTIKRYILENDLYNLQLPYMMDILQTARHNNPAFVKLTDLQKYLGSSRAAFKEAVINNQLNIITQNPYRLTYLDDFAIDLSDEKNQAFLKTIQNDDFQIWLSNRLEAYREYRSENDRQFEKFKTKKAPTYEESYKEIQEQLGSIAEKRRLEAQEKKLKKQQRKDEISRSSSLRNTIAWVLAPNTRQVRKELSNAHLQTIFAKHKEVKEINDLLLSGEITLDEAKQRIQALKLSKQDEIDVLSYHKTCWEISGTGEWKQALADSKKYAEIYETMGLDGIDNPDMKARLIRWEEEHKA